MHIKSNKNRTSTLNEHFFIKQTNSCLNSFYFYIKQDNKENKSRWSFLIRALKNTRSNKMVVFYIHSFIFVYESIIPESDRTFLHCFALIRNCFFSFAS
jgi:hypothetical protein